MIQSAREYFAELPGRFGAGWNRFWFKPSDPAALCLLRIFTGLVALYLHATFSYDLVRLFSAQGILSPDVVARWSAEPPVAGWPGPGALEMGGLTVDRLSYLSYVTSPTWLGVLHGLGFFVLAAFTLGVFTRATSILAWLVAVSYVHRAPMLVSQVEPVLCMLLFYLCLSPCGECFSLDRWLTRRKSKNPEDLTDETPSVQRFFSATVCTRLIQIHLAALYFMMALAKLAGGTSTVWWTGEAMWMLIARPDARLVDLTWLAAHPFLIDFWTHAVLAFELAFPLLIFNATARPLLIVASFLIWGPLALVTGLTAFCLLMILANTVFVSPRWLRQQLGQVSIKRGRARKSMPSGTPELG